MSSIPFHLIEGCTAAHRRLEAVLPRVTETVARRASLLPGWSVGTVLNHLARNADSHTGVFLAAAQGEVRAQYPGGQEQRAQLIADGQDNPAELLAANLREANARLEVAWGATTEEVWASGLGLRTLGAISLPEFVFLRWREVELHGIDLGLADLGGPDWATMSHDYAPLEIDLSVRTLSQRLSAGTAVHIIPDGAPSFVAGLSFTPRAVRGNNRLIVQWLTGRGGRPDWPELGPW